MLTLGQQVHGLEPEREGQLGAFENGSCGRAGLLPAVLALEQATGDATVPRGPTFWADEPLRPAGTDQGIPAGVLAAVVLKKVPKAESLLELTMDPAARLRGAGNVITRHAETPVSLPLP